MRKQQGVALITVLLVMAIIAVIATNLGTQLQRQVTRTASFEQSEQSYWMWLSGEAVLKEVLQQEIERNDGIVHANQNWAQRAGPFPVEGGQIAAQVTDLRSCFNLNSLAGTEQQGLSLEKRRKQFQQLLVSLELDAFQAESLAGALTDWLDSDSELSQSGAEDPDYEALPHPYQTANGLLFDVSELRMIKGFTAKVVQRIKPYVCAIPGNAELRINVNTLDEERAVLLVAVTQGKLTMDGAKQLIQARPEAGYESREELLQDSLLTGAQDGETGALDELAVSSEYFLLQAYIQWGSLETTARSVLRVTSGQARVVYRAMGED
jgi:general secretion pathway protein K